MRKKITHKNTQKILEIDGCDGCTTMWKHLMSLNYALKYSSKSKFYAIYIYIYNTTVRQKEVTLSYDFELGKGFLNINWKHNPKKKKNFW